MNWVLIIMFAGYANFQGFDTQASCEVAKRWVLENKTTSRMTAECVKK